MMMMGMTAASDNEGEDKVGTELLTLTVLHVIKLKMTPQLKCQLIAKTQAFEGLS